MRSNHASPSPCTLGLPSAAFRHTTAPDLGALRPTLDNHWAYGVWQKETKRGGERQKEEVHPYNIVKLAGRELGV